MRPSSSPWVVASVATLLSVPLPSAGQGRPQPAHEADGSSGAYGRLYDPAKVQKLRGQVSEVRKITALRDTVAVVVATPLGDEVVHLGPAWYVDHQRTRVAKGDTIEVEGSRVTFGGSPVMLATRVRKGDEVLRLRDDAGVPAWAGRGPARDKAR